MSERKFAMEPSSFNGNAGKVEFNKNGEPTFTPNDAPQELQLNKMLLALNSKADRFVGELRGMFANLDSADLFVNSFIAREAKLSSELEGTHTKLSEVFKAEAKLTKPTMEITEVRNAINSFNYGLHNRDKPINEILKTMHQLLFQKIPSAGTRGDFRREQNFIGPTTRIEDAWYVPPAVEALPRLMDSFEAYYQKEATEVFDEAQELPPLIKAAIIHYQFETIHPFSDGNGRLGRFLIPLFLLKNNTITKPVFFISEFFRDKKQNYKDILLETSKTGNFDRWVQFFLAGVIEQTRNTIDQANKLNALREKYKNELIRMGADARIIKMVDRLFRNPYITIPEVADDFSITYPTAKSDISRLQTIGALKQVSDAKTHKIFCATEIFEVIIRNKKDE